MSVTINSKPLAERWESDKMEVRANPVQEREQQQAVKYFFSTWCGPVKDTFDKPRR